jgi:hypothetical protein
MVSVLGLSHKSNGCGWHRVMLPLAFLPNSYNHVTNIPTEELFKERKFNILLFNRFCFLDKDWSVRKNKIRRTTL